MRCLLIIFILSLSLPNLAFGQVSDGDLTERFKAQRYYYLTLLDLGHKAFKDEEYPKAMEYVISAIKHSGKQGHKDYKPYEELGDIYRRQDRRDDAAWAYYQAILILEKQSKNTESNSIRQRLEWKIGDAEPELTLPPMEFPELRAKAEEEFRYKRREIAIKVKRKKALRELQIAINEMAKVSIEELIAVYQTEPKPSLAMKSRYKAILELILAYYQISQLSTLEVFQHFNQSRR